jgi:hypothetical protein
MYEGALLVEEEAVVPDLVEMCVHLGGRGVGSAVEVALNGREVHGFLHDVVVVEDTVAFGVDGYEEGEGALMLLELGEDVVALSELVLDW